MRDKAGLILPVLLIIIAETFTFSSQTEASLAVHALNIFICMLIPVFKDEGMLIYQSFALISMLRVLNIGMPIFFDLTIYWLPFIYGSIILAGYIIWRQTVVDAKKVHWKNAIRFLNGSGLRDKVQWRWEYVLFAIIFGFLFANMEYLVLGNEAMVNDLGMYDLTTLFLVMVLFVGLGEELVFRAFLQSSISPKYGRVAAVLLSAFLFAIMHAGYHNVSYLFFVFTVGLILGISYERTGSLGLVMLMHGILNFFLFSLIPLGYNIV